MQKLVEKLQRYAEEYNHPPYGREIEGTPELLLEAADSLKETEESIQKLKTRFVDGMEVHRQGWDESDGIECPFCGYEVARNDDYDEIRPKHCPECGTKLIY